MELFSAAVVLRRFYIGEHAERQAARIAAILLYLLAAFVLVSSVVSLLNRNLRARPSYLGIGLLMAENLRSGFVWETFARNPEVGVAMNKAGFHLPA